MATNQSKDPIVRSIVSGLLAWLVPGAGHWYLGHRGLAGVYFGAISFCFLLGALIGGVKTSIDPVGNKWLFLAEMCVGSYTAGGYALAATIPSLPPTEFSEYVATFPANDLAQIYLAVAGLLNLLAILDALARAQTGGLPVFHHERVRAAAAEEAR